MGSSRKDAIREMQAKSCYMPSVSCARATAHLRTFKGDFDVTIAAIEAISRSASFRWAESVAAGACATLCRLAATPAVQGNARAARSTSIALSKAALSNAGTAAFLEARAPFALMGFLTSEAVKEDAPTVREVVYVLHTMAFCSEAGMQMCCAAGVPAALVALLAEPVPRLNFYSACEIVSTITCSRTTQPARPSWPPPVLCQRCSRWPAFRSGMPPLTRTCKSTERSLSCTWSARVAARAWAEVSPAPQAL